MICCKYNFFFIFILIFTSSAYSNNKPHNNTVFSNGIILSIDSIYSVIEPDNHIIFVKRENASHADVPFSWLNHLKPTSWFDYEIKADSYSYVLSKVNVLLDNGSTINLEKVLIRVADEDDGRKIREYIINSSYKTIISHRKTKFKSKIKFFKNERLLSLYTKNSNDDFKVFIARIKIMSLEGIKQNDGTYKFQDDNYFGVFFEIGYLSIELTIRD